MSKAKACQLRKLSKDELVTKLEDFQKELAGLRVEKVTAGATSKLAKIKNVRKSVAVVKTVMHEMTRNALKKAYAKKKYIPKDLRQKKTRAMRRELTAFEASRKTLRQRKRDLHFKPQVYALKA
eukprot:m.351282 g.351282  ORF g.351282 m.351282 type:complete len:124 (+) comp16212_c0_seq1:250-621(+)